MTRFVVASLIAVVIGGAAVSAADPPRAALRQFVCQRALDPAARGIAVTVVMRPLVGTEHMAVKVQLLRRPSRHARFVAVRGGDLGKWATPPSATLGQQPGDVWRHVKQVVNLPAGTYKFRVAFRWTGATGQVLGTALRLSPLCFQPELRPDLRVVQVSVLPETGAPGRDEYLATIWNAGRTAAGPFATQLEVDGQLYGTKSVPGLDPNTSRQVDFHAPACASGSTVSVLADADGSVDDYNRTNNTLSVSCPGG